MAAERLDLKAAVVYYGLQVPADRVHALVRKAGAPPPQVSVRPDKQPLEGLELGQVVEDDVRIVRMMDKVVLMVGLGWIEGLKRLYAGRDASLKYVCVIELSDLAAGDHELRLVA